MSRRMKVFVNIPTHSVVVDIDIDHPDYTPERVAKLLADGKITLYIAETDPCELCDGDIEIGKTSIHDWGGVEMEFTEVFEIDGEDVALQ